MRRRDRHPSRASVERDLARLADGTLDPAKRERVERLVASSPELQARLRDQRRAIDAVRSVANCERAPLAVHVRRRALDAGPRRRGALFGLGAIAAAGALVWTVALLTASQAGLTVAQAAALAARPATIPVSEPRNDGVTIPHLRAAGLPFPYWEDHFDWRAQGARTDRLDGRPETTVFYRRDGEAVAYTIVSGKSLPTAPGAQTITRAGTELTSYSIGGAGVVTWLRRGHTCVLSGRGVPLQALLKLAVWRGRGQIPF